MAGQVKDHGVGAITGLISAGAVALIGELFKNAVSEGVESGGIAFWLTMIAAALAMIIAYIFSYNYSVIFREYGLDSADADERAVFDGLRKRLAEGGRFVPVYNDLMTRALDRVDRFFGDSDPAVKTLWPGAFGFTGKKPFWTAPAYDRCLLIALLYPLAVLFVVWGVSGEVGAAEEAFLLRQGIGEWQRSLFLLAVAIMSTSVFIFNSAVLTNNYIKYTAVILFFITAISIASTNNFSFALSGFLVVALSLVISIFFIGFNPGFGSVVVAVVICVSSNVVFFIDNEDSKIFAFALAFVSAAVVSVFCFVIRYTVRRKSKLGLLLLAMSVISMLFCYIDGYLIGATNAWNRRGQFVLFFGVLTLINAPFDWASIGLTRALLRRGVEAGGFAPLGYALLDLLLATGMIAALAAVMVFAVDLFEVVGRTKIIDVDATLMALADPWQRGQTQYWWIYATLFSTLIPSILNVAVAALSLMRGWAWFHQTVAAKMRSGKPMMEIHLIWMPAALAFEVMIAVLAGLLLTGWWIFKAVPYLARPVEWLIPLLQWVAALV